MRQTRSRDRACVSLLLSRLGIGPRANFRRHRGQERLRPFRYGNRRPDDAGLGLEKLKKGNARFVEKNMRSRDWLAKVSATAGGQYPFAVILACMDSRAPVEIIFGSGNWRRLGIRIAGNVVNEDVLGSMEYATKVVGSKLLVVLGHTSCGAVKGSIDDAKLGNLTGLLAKIRPAVSASGPGSSKDDATSTKSPRPTCLRR